MECCGRCRAPATSLRLPSSSTNPPSSSLPQVR
eukprot:jgi/Mesen1/7495/ME000039S06714